MVVYFGEFIEIIVNVAAASLAMSYGEGNFNKALLAGGGSFAGELVSNMLIFKNAKLYTSHQYTYPIIAALAVYANETLNLNISDTMAMAIGQLIYLAGVGTPVINI